MTKSCSDRLYDKNTVHQWQKKKQAEAIEYWSLNRTSAVQFLVLYYIIALHYNCTDLQRSSIRCNTELNGRAALQSIDLQTDKIRKSKNQVLLAA